MANQQSAMNISFLFAFKESKGRTSKIVCDLLFKWKKSSSKFDTRLL